MDFVGLWSPSAAREHQRSGSVASRGWAAIAAPLHHHSHLKAFLRCYVGFPYTFVVEAQESLPLGDGFELQYNLARCTELVTFGCNFDLAHLVQIASISSRHDEASTRHFFTHRWNWVPVRAT